MGGASMSAASFYKYDGLLWFLRDQRTLIRGDGASTMLLAIDQWDDGLPKIGSEYGLPCDHLGNVAPVNKVEVKPTNPKDAVGSSKVSYSMLPAPVLAEAALALTEGALKYGKHNYRGVGVRGSVYYDASLRHLTAWWEGEDIDPESGLSHVTKAIAGLMVLRDCMIRGNFNDDRPPKSPKDWMVPLNEHTAKLREQYRDRDPKHYFEKEQ